MIKREEKFKYYKDQIEFDYGIKISEIEKILPPYCKEFRLNIADNYRKSSQYNTLYDIKIFLLFLKEGNPELKDLSIKQIPLSILDNLKLQDIDEFKDWLSGYEADNGFQSNTSLSKRRKLSSLKAFFGYLTKSEHIRRDPTVGCVLPKIPDKEVVALTDEQIIKLLECVKTGEGKTKRERKIHEKIYLRDYSIVTMLLGTGMRVSELIALNFNNINFDPEGTKIKVIRKGGKEDHVYIGLDVEEALLSYLDYCRMNLLKNNDEVQALYVSWNGTRLTVRAVEKLIAKYSMLALGEEIHPHNLRSTRGSQIYSDTGDIENVKEVLGHSSIVTSSNYYVKGSEERKKSSMRPLYKR